MEIHELGPGETPVAAAALLELRPHLRTVEAVAERAEEQPASGHRFARER